MCEFAVKLCNTYKISFMTFQLQTAPSLCRGGMGAYDA